MCGLFGWQWKEGHHPDKRQRRALVAELAKSNDKRGGQSWGVWGPNIVLRGLGPSGPHSHRFHNLPMAFGHSRWATHGVNEILNTHPFIEDGVSLAHNGVISNHSKLNTKFNRTHVVDSQHILSHMLESKPFTDIEGYGTIVWNLPSQAESIYMGRMTERGELWVAETAYGMVWTSDKAHGIAALKEAGIREERHFEVEVGKAYYCEKGKFYEDTAFPSIRISPPEVYTHYSEYTSPSQYVGGYIGGGSIGEFNWQSNTVLWCNKHKQKYAQCSCKGPLREMAWVKSVPDDVAAGMKQGDEYVEPVWTGPCIWGPCTKHRETNSMYCVEHQTPSSRGGGTTGYRSFCLARGCTARPVEGSEYCASCTEKKSSTEDAREEHSLAAHGYHKCAFVGCQVWTMSPTCMEHQDRRPPDAPIAPIQLTQVVRGPAQAYIPKDPANWGGSDDEVTASDRAAIGKDLAEWWLQTNHPETITFLGSMTDTEILQLAMSEGFNVEEAVNEALNITTLAQESAHAPKSSSTVSES